MLSEIKLRGAWRKIRSKIGIRSGKVAIKSHTPWYIKFGGYGVMMGVAGAVVWYLVDNSYKITGFNREEATAQIAKLTEGNERLKREYDLAKTLLNEREGQLKVEKSAQAELEKQFAASGIAQAVTLRDTLAKYNKVFEQVRYIHESVNLGNLPARPDELRALARFFRQLTDNMSEHAFP